MGILHKYRKVKVTRNIRNFRNATGGTSVLQIRGQYYFPGTIHAKITGIAASSGFSKGQDVTYENGNTVISGKIIDISDNLFNENPTGHEYTIILPYNGPVIAIMGGGIIYPTPGTIDTTISAPLVIQTPQVNQPVISSPVISSAVQYPVLSAPVITAEALSKGTDQNIYEAYSTITDPVSGITRMIYNPVVATPIVQPSGDVVFNPVDLSQYKVQDASTVESSPVVDTAADIPAENNLGIIQPSTQPLTAIKEAGLAGNKFNISTVVVIALLGGLLIYGFKVK